MGNENAKPKKGGGWRSIFVKDASEEDPTPKESGGDNIVTTTPGFPHYSGATAPMPTPITFGPTVQQASAAIQQNVQTTVYADPKLVGEYQQLLMAEIEKSNKPGFDFLEFRAAIIKIIRFRLFFNIV